MVDTTLELAAIKYVQEHGKMSGAMIQGVLKLHLLEQCSVPFIARYRKEQTSNADEQEIYEIIRLHEEYGEREKRRSFVLKAIEKMDKLTDGLKAEILKAKTIQDLEDLYAPFKSKRKTKAQVAMDKNLGPLAELMVTTPMNLEAFEAAYSKDFVPGPDGSIKDFMMALDGAMDILIYTFAHDLDLKDAVRQKMASVGRLVSTLRPKAEEIEDYKNFQDYFDYNTPISKLFEDKATHRFLGLRRGSQLKILKVDCVLEGDDELYPILLMEAKYFAKDQNLGLREMLLQCADRAFKNYLLPSLDLEFKSELKKKADNVATSIFGKNLKDILLAPYLGAKSVLSIDPGVRTGCKIAVIDKTGKLAFHTVIYPHPPKQDVKGSIEVLRDLVNQYQIEYIAIGNGTYGRETLEMLRDHFDLVESGKVKATIIAETGASIYSVSPLARSEFPDLDPTVRGAISIGRRFQDPLAELIKIDPKSLGVGQYQHDVNQMELKKSLTQVVDNCVNYVGVDINTASAPLLSHVAGLNDSIASELVAFRDQHGPYISRRQLSNVKGMTPKIFQQAGGFLRIYGGDYPLDGTFVHPERYSLLENWVARKSRSIGDLLTDANLKEELKNDTQLSKEVGELTHKDIYECLTSAKQDPRTEFVGVEFAKNIRELSDLKLGQWYPGVVTNITHFGAFVDIGPKENGLLHISQISRKFIENAMDQFQIGQVVQVKVIELDKDRKRVALSMIQDTPASSSTSYSSTNSGANKTKAQAPTGGNKNSRQQDNFKNNPFAVLKGINFKN